VSWRRVAALGLLGLAIPLMLGRTASPPPPPYFLADQASYLAMADPPAHPDNDTHGAPFCWRVLPSALVRVSRLPPEAGFQVLTLATLALIPPLTAAFVAAAGASASSAFVAGATIAVAPAVAGYLSWDYIRPDGLSLLLIVLSAWSLVRGRGVIFVAALAALALTKETWILSAAFALVWTHFCRPASRKWAVAGSLLALGLALALRLAIPPSHHYSWIENARALYLPLDGRTIARRLLLATASTWNVLTPIAGFALARRIREPSAWAVAIALTIATSQILVAIDTQRLVAAGYPFVLLACTWVLDRLPRRLQPIAGGSIVIAQGPWLVTYARSWDLPLRGMEIALTGVTLAAIVYGLTRDRNRPARHAC
jgi:hypothetical protein